ncbi:MAG: Na/Pi cotransporter family protein [Bacteroidia bacterium]
MLWSSKGKFKTDRKWGIYKLLVLLGSLGLFIFGMKVMSEGLQQSAGGKLRSILGSMTSNRYLGVLSGFLITALVQSSSATTVMTVSFVNAGLLTLVESAGVMMGANIGTTITGWLVSLLGFKVSISSYALIFIALGAPLMFVARKKLNAWSNAIIGFAILFMGIGLLKDAVPSLDADSPIIAFFSGFGDNPLLGRVMFVFLGTLVTIVVQSSSAAMTLTLTMVLGGIIPFEVGAAMILGENIGTTITAEIASLVGNVHAKRSARIHSMFNIIGVTWMIFLMPFFLRGITGFMDNSMGIDIATDSEGATVALAAFHTVFNLSNVLIMIWFVPWLVRMAQRTVKSKGEDDEVFKLEYIHRGLLATPELSVLEAKKEVLKFAQLDRKMLKRVHALINETEPKKISKIIKKIGKYEDITDSLEKEIADYLGKVSSNELSDKSSTDLRAMLSIINDLERVGDIFFEFSKIVEKKVENKIWFEQNQRSALNEMVEKLEVAFDIMENNLNSHYNEVDINDARLAEDELNEMRNKIRKAHLKSVQKGDYKPAAGLAYSNMFSSLERVGDHLINVSEAITGINLY